MTPDSVIVIGQQALVVTAMLSAPLLLAALAAGLVIGMFQAATQINEVTLSFIPKLLVLAAALYVGGGWMLKVILGYSESLIRSIPSLIRLSMQIPLEVIEALLGNVLSAERVAVLPHRRRRHGRARVRRAARADARAHRAGRRRRPSSWRR